LCISVIFLSNSNAKRASKKTKPPKCTEHSKGVLEEAEDVSKESNPTDKDKEEEEEGAR
jgi:hypothetical protein